MDAFLVNAGEASPLPLCERARPVRSEFEPESEALLSVSAAELEQMRNRPEHVFQQPRRFARAGGYELCFDRVVIYGGEPIPAYRVMAFETTSETTGQELYQLLAGPDGEYYALRRHRHECSLRVCVRMTGREAARWLVSLIVETDHFHDQIFDALDACAFSPLIASAEPVEVG